MLPTKYLICLHSFTSFQVSIWYGIILLYTTELTLSWGSTSRSWKKRNTVKAQTSSYMNNWNTCNYFYACQKSLNKRVNTRDYYLTLINSIQTKFSSSRQHMQTSIKKEDSLTQPLIVLWDKHHAKNVLTSITLDTRYGRVLFTLIFSAFSCKRDDFIKQIFSF